MAERGIRKSARERFRRHLPKFHPYQEEIFTIKHDDSIVIDYSSENAHMPSTDTRQHTQAKHHTLIEIRPIHLVFDSAPQPVSFQDYKPERHEVAMSG